ncbi:hypothetical protein SmJEL517_g04109 [Synchytrium microbalum]|uniref:Large ribosomal subunit protein uL14m n=1 Tax=Synchytrium microbalum TaxID=1806994 RepID=A0A507BZJ2_9FUNG|nr:uncharacterized protein SmJEL517_g04109 [Synchytrium microbalum]TPX32852.1 hypothetical protein SmJEL517_g04109 [Synchytrium microbalum]
MIQLKTICKVIDNSGALLVECINVIGGSKIASLGDEIVCVVKKARPATIDSKAAATTGAAAANMVTKLKQGDVSRALVVRTRKEVRRLDGSYVKFDDNAVVMMNKQQQPIGNRVLGVLANECKQKRWAKVTTMGGRLI